MYGGVSALRCELLDPLRFDVVGASTASKAWLDVHFMNHQKWVKEVVSTDSNIQILKDYLQWQAVRDDDDVIDIKRSESESESEIWIMETFSSCHCWKRKLRRSAPNTFELPCRLNDIEDGITGTFIDSAAFQSFRNQWAARRTVHWHFILRGSLEGVLSWHACHHGASCSTDKHRRNFIIATVQYVSPAQWVIEI